MPAKRAETRKELRKAGPAIALGTNLTAGIVGCTLIGYWIDRRRGGGQAATLTGLLIGLVYGGYEVWKVVQGIQEQDRNSPPK